MLFFSLQGAARSGASVRERWQAVSRVAKQNVILSNQHEAACAILLRLCDCVLETDADMRILEAGQQLGAMLFTQVSLLAGKNLRDLCVPGHEPKLDTMSGTCSMTKVRLKTSDGVDFPAILYYVSFIVDGKYRYLMGLTDDSQNLSSDTFTPNILPVPFSNLQTHSRCDDDSDLSSNASNTCDEEAEATASLADGFPIISYSRGFSKYVARAGSVTHLTDCIEPKEKVGILGAQASSLVHALVDMPSTRVAVTSSSGKHYRADAELIGISLVERGKVRDIMMQVSLREIKCLRTSLHQKGITGRPGPISIGSASSSSEHKAGL